MESLFKNRFAKLHNVAESKDLSKQSLNLIILCISTQRKLTYFDEQLKHGSYLFVFKCGEN